MAALSPRLQLARHRTRLTITPDPSAACAVSRAKVAPGRGKSSESSGRRQVMQTKIVIAAAIPSSSADCTGGAMDVTRVDPSAVPTTGRSGALLLRVPSAIRNTDEGRKAPGHPAQHATARTVGLLA